ncbi:amiloride sensitive cation channel 4 A [Echinococcus multilocularis]|uniref:Amiloride sensitive cation channel 4 A n=1 Tax=Echinococcus multilocularis TaxID=6211 RepID=A0A068YF85_ECHMU|nr:amiloride sensitive cation channel 4 A [Echinococcus multilocularis]
MRFYMRFIEGAFFLVSIVVLVVLLGLRFKYWKESSQGGGPGYGSILTSSDLTISKLEESPAVNVPFPFFSLCNANPARGSILFGLHAENEKSPLWYENFLDALLARPLSLKVDGVDGAHNANFHLMLNHTAHEMKNMLVECRISSRTCSHVQFVKHVLPSGVCYTFRGELKPSEKLHLELDPESVDYLIPNSGLVGFRFLIHETPEPHWVHHQSAVFLGAQFHTMLRLVGTRKVYESDCVPQRTWEACLRKCLLFRIQKECGCIFSASNDGCNLESISNCSIQLDVLQESISLSACSCIGPCDQLVYTYESITQAWQPFFPGFRGFRRFQPLHPRNEYNQSNLDEKIPRAFNRFWLNSPKQSEKVYQLSTSIQLWAFLREANRNVFHELMSLDETLLSLHRLTKEMLNVVKVIGQAVNYSRGGGSHLMNSLLHAKGKKISIFDENCLDQTEQTGMLVRVSQLSDAFTNRLQESFLFDTTQATVQLNLIMIFLQRSPLDFSRLLNDLRISDLISDVTVLELRRNAQKCHDAAHGVNGLLSNFTMRELFPLNSSVTRAGDVSRGNGNVISSLQAMLLATDSNLNKLNVEFSRLYDQNKVLIQEMRGLLASQSSIEQRHSRVAVTVQISSRQGLSLRLKSSESLFNKNGELLDILTSAVMIGSFLVLLAEGVFTTMWECRLRLQSQKQKDLLKHHFEHRVPRGIPSSLSSPPLASLSQQQLETVVLVSTRSPKPPGGSPRYAHSLSRDQTKLPAYNVKWNHLTLAQPQKFVGQFMRQQEQQHPLFLDITESISDINTPSTFTHPLSDVV